MVSMKISFFNSNKKKAIDIFSLYCTSGSLQIIRNRIFD